MIRRNGLILKTVAIVLACTMPICCCFFNTISGGGSSCCSTEKTASCCPQPSVEWLDELLGPIEQEQPIEESCGGTCCVKGFVLTQNWTPPVDFIGSDLPAFLLQDAFVDSFLLSTSSISMHPPPLIDINLLGYSNAAPLRGAVILQV